MFDDTKVGPAYKALVDEGLRVGDPTQQQGLVYAVPADWAPTNILNRYSGPDLLRCAVCATDKKHKKGITLEFADGQKALCGLVCARKFFGETTINALDRSFEFREQQVILKNLVEPVREGIDEVIETLSPQVGALELKICELVRELSYGFWKSPLRNLEGSYLIKRKTRKVRDFNATSFEVEGADENGREKFKRVEEEVVRVSFATFLGDVEGKKLVKAGHRLRKLKRELDENPTQNEELRRILTERQEAFLEIQAGVAVLIEASQFFQKSNLEKFAQWLNEPSDKVRAQVKSNGSKLRIIDSRDEVELAMPTIDVPRELRNLDGIRKALNIKR